MVQDRKKTFENCMRLENDSCMPRQILNLWPNVKLGDESRVFVVQIHEVPYRSKDATLFIVETLFHLASVKPRNTAIVKI